VYGPFALTRVTVPEPTRRSRLRNRFRCERSAGSTVRTPALARSPSSAVCSSDLQRFLEVCLLCPAKGCLLRVAVLCLGPAEPILGLHVGTVGLATSWYHNPWEPKGFSAEVEGIRRVSLSEFILSLTGSLCRLSKAYLWHGDLRPGLLSDRLRAPSSRGCGGWSCPHAPDRAVETGLSRTLTLISAPVGFGRTTLLGE
jgi:hypothetical protein